MESQGQLRLVLWKDALVRRKQPGLVLLIFGWTIVVFIILYIVRASIVPEYNHTCQYKARALPSAGLFSFLQSFACNIENKCDNLENFEEIPQYRNAIMTDVYKTIQPIYEDEEFKSVIDYIPGIAQLFKGVVKTIDKSNEKGVIAQGIEIKNLFKNSDQVKRKIINDKLIDGDIADVLFESHLKFDAILKSLESVDKGIDVCNPDELKRLIILKNLNHINNVSEALCNFDDNRLTAVIEKIAANTDFDELLGIVSNISKLITNYNLYEDVGKVSKMILNFKSIDPIVPKYLNMSDWLPKIFPLLKNISKEGITEKLYTDILKVLDPYFDQFEHWKEIKNATIQVFSIIIPIQNNLIAMNSKNNTIFTTEKYAQYVERLRQDLEEYDLGEKDPIFMNTFNTTMQILYQFYADNTDYEMKIALLMDSLFYMKYTIRPLRDIYILSATIGKSMSIFHDISYHFNYVEEIFYNASLKHEKSVKDILKLGPEFVWDLSSCLYNTSCTKVLVNQTVNDLVCDESVTVLIFPSVPAEKLIDTLCTQDTIEFIEELYKEYEIDKTYKIDFILGHLEFKEPIFAQMVLDYRKLNEYGVRRNIKNYDWSQFTNDTNLIQSCSHLNEHKRLFLVNLKLSSLMSEEHWFKQNIMIGSDLLVEGILFEFDLIPTSLFINIQKNLLPVIDNIIRTFIRDFNELSAIPVDDWTPFFCDTSKVKDEKQKAIKMISCQAVKYIKTRWDKFWVNNPYLGRFVASTRRNHLEWEEFMLNSRSMMLRVEEFFENKPTNDEWNRMEIFHTKFWSEWLKNVDSRAAVQMGFQIFSNLVENLLTSYYDIMSHLGVRNTLMKSLKSNYVMVLINKVVDVALNLNSLNKTYIMENYPLSHNMSNIVLNHLSELQMNLKDLDVFDLMLSLGNKNVTANYSNKTIEFLALKEFIQNQDIANELGFGIVKPMHPYERDVTIFELDLATDNLRMFLFDFNYKNANVKKSMISVNKQLEITDKIIDIQSIFFDDLLNNTALTSHPNTDLYTLWQEYAGQNCSHSYFNYYKCRELLYNAQRYTAFYILHVLDEIIKATTTYLENIYGDDPVDPWMLAGFKKSSTIAGFTKNLPYYLELFVHNYRRKDFENSISHMFAENIFSCYSIFSALEIPQKSQLTTKQVDLLQRYICNADDAQNMFKENIFVEMFMKVKNDVYKPLSQVSLKIPRVVADFIKLVQDFNNKSETKKVKISPVWTDKWTNDLYKSLDNISKLNFTTNNTIMRYLRYPDLHVNLVEMNNYITIPKILVEHIMKSLKRFKGKDIKLTDFSDNLELRKLLNLSETHPLELTSVIINIFTQYTHNAQNVDLWSFTSGYCQDPRNNSEIVHQLRSLSERKVKEEFCKIDLAYVKDYILPDSKIQQVLNENFNLEQTLIDLISISSQISKLNPSNHLFAPFIAGFTNVSVPSKEYRWNISLVEAHYVAQNPQFAYYYDGIVVGMGLLLRSLQAGNWDQNFRNSDVIEYQHIYKVLEKIPFLGVHLPELFITEKSIYTIFNKFISGVHFCEIDFIKENFKEDNIIILMQEIGCHLTGYFRTDKLIYNDNGIYRVNVTHLATHIFEAQNAAIDLSKTGVQHKLPDWLNKDAIQTAYKNFTNNYNNMRQLQQLLFDMFDDIVKLGENSLNSGTTCDGTCSIIVALTKEINRQINLAPDYVDFVCQLPKLNSLQIQKQLGDTLKWSSFGDYFRGRYTTTELTDELHMLISNIRKEFLIFTTNDTLYQQSITCIKDLLQLPETKNFTTYIQMTAMLMNLTKTSNLNFMQGINSNPVLSHYIDLISKDITIPKPIREVIHSEKDFMKNLQEINTNQDIMSAILNAKIDANQLVKIQNYNDTSKYFMSHRWFDKLFSFDNQIENDEVFYNLTTTTDDDFYRVFYNSINKELLMEKLPTWRRESVESLEWLKNIIVRLEGVVSNSINILKFVSETDFSLLFSESEKISDLAEGIIELLEKNSIEKFFSSLKSLIKNLSPIISNPVFEDDLTNLVVGIESLDVFKHLGLLRTKYQISKLIQNWPEAKTYLMQELKVDAKTADAITTSSLDVFNILNSHRAMLTTNNIVCDSEKLSTYIKYPNENNETNQNVSKVLCGMSFDDARKIISLGAKNLNLVEVLDNVTNSSFNEILNSASMSKETANIVIQKIGYALHVLPPVLNIVDKLPIEISNIAPQALKSRENFETSPDFVSLSNQLLCGYRFSDQNNKFFNRLFDVKDFNEEFDQNEQNSLSTPYCRKMYKNIIKMKGGKIIWSYLKPLIRGKILYTPDVPYVRNIIEKANSSLEKIHKLNNILYKISTGILSLKNVENFTESFTKIHKFLDSSMGKVILKMIVKNATNSPSKSIKSINMTNIFNYFEYSQVMTIVENTKDILECLSLDRFIPVETEEELERLSKKYQQNNEFIAGIVFTNEGQRSKRSTNIPRNITYKIRMDVDSVPSTSLLKFKFWTPNREDDFVENMRYFRGFVELQDMIDHAIVDLQSSDSVKWKTYTQQMPSPCHTEDYFQSILNISQLLQVGFFFGLITIVSVSVRFLVFEKESGNTMIMNVMGLKYLTHCISWFILSYILMVLVMIVVFLIVKVGGLISMTNGFIFFVYLLLFGYSIMMFCYMVSCIFNSASIAAVGSIIFYLLSYMPYIIIISVETMMPTWIKVFVNFSMSTSFCYGCLYVLRYEIQGVGLQWHNMWQSPLVNDNMSFGLTCVFLIIDGLLYGLIGFICTKLSEDARKVYYNLCSRWCGGKNLSVDQSPYITFDCELFSFLGDNYLDETVSSSTGTTDDNQKISVTVKNLTKTYTSRKKTVMAIENINMMLYTGQVTTLLGHNGAGKTTLIKILTGMMKPCNGQIIINSEITNFSMTRQFLGVCPQTSVLLENLSPLEHLQFYARLKTGKSNKDIMEDVVNMLDNLGLEGLATEPVSHLSEGNRRRLCVAIAFIGRPSLVVLDEPSSGVDPVARRQIWDLIVRLKQGRTVLMTTHYLDEAELLSDRVIILHKGKTLCSGSPLTLKHTYGQGYKLSVTYSSIDESARDIENKAQVLMETVHDVVPNSAILDTQNCTVNVSVPFLSCSGSPNDFEKLTSTLEKNQESLGYESMTINCTTLEQVYLDLCAQEDGIDMDNDEDQLLKSHKSNSSVVTKSVNDLSPDDRILINDEELLTGHWTNKFLALIKKRAIHYVQDWRIIMTALILPTLFVAIAMGFSTIRPSNLDEPALKLSADLYDTHSASFVSANKYMHDDLMVDVTSHISRLINKPVVTYNMSSRDCTCTSGIQHCSKSSEKMYDNLLQLNSVSDTMNWLVETYDEYIEKRYGGWSLANVPKKDTFVVWYNSKGYHSMSSYFNTMNNAILRTVNPGASITTYNHPLKLSVEQLSKNSIAQHVADVGISMVLLIAFCLVPASASIYLVQERISEEKRLQFLSGVSPTLYWSVAWIWDMIVLLCALILASIIFKLFNLPSYTSRDNLDAICLLVFLYGWATIPMVHLMEKLFRDASMANMIIFCSFLFIGITELTSLLLIDVLSNSETAEVTRSDLHSIYLIFPQFVLGDGLVEISKNNMKSELLKRFHMDTYISPLSWELLGVHYLSLFFVGLLLFTINLVIENKWFIPKKKSTEISLDMNALETVNLTKQYKMVSGLKTAVDNLSLQIPVGQCLGLIGVNGAGKSTTFKMLTTELTATSGQIYVQGEEIGDRPFCSGEMGYCPQNNALDPKLTVRQTLDIYVTLKGITNKDEIVAKIMHKFELLPYHNRKTENLSGGNKRKLCAAVAVLGKSSLILMDEPTSGMDPYSRNLIAQIVEELTKQNKSVILTSHSVEDCESLCSMVAVMINGKVVCKGSPHELKEKFGSGYIISIRLSKPSEQKELLEQMKKCFPGSQLQSIQYCTSQFIVMTDKVSEMFRIMKEISNVISIEEFNLVQSSLDQVFINLASKNKHLEEHNLVTPDMYSMNVI